ncbi:MAG: DUF721 domain-containing protein [Aphanocapsa sp. GSE-SYN-MK-11-07L]|jgi:predicted nucleic acid-binding Zn ribbon protein|nr:DUF721 domain-containing protein [Aphanocapsa sp. GSE-SYN-MK-11-07L]
MPFQPVKNVLSTLPKRQGWREYQQFQEVLSCWTDVVGAAVALQTRPQNVAPRGVLKVATSSSVWAQNLGFERRQILSKLNAHLELPLTDLYFSCSQWQPTPQPLLVVKPPSALKQAQLIQSPSPQTAFQRWENSIKRRSQHLPLCPRCQCPTPRLELEQHDGLCNLCSVR